LDVPASLVALLAFFLPLTGVQLLDSDGMVASPKTDKDAMVNELIVRVSYVDFSTGGPLPRISKIPKKSFTLNELHSIYQMVAVTVLQLLT
jgi:hypothetical protein